MSGRKQSDIQMTVDQYLAAVVVRNPAAQSRQTEDGDIELAMPYRKPWLARLFTRPGKPYLRKFQLDSTGSDLWRQIDDHRTVADLADHLRASQNLPPQQASDSVIAFVQMLVTRGLIGLVVTP